MPAEQGFKTLEFTETFLNTLLNLSKTDQRHVVQALSKLDANERTPSLRVHPLQGKLAGLWSVSASKSVRFTFLRLDTGRKLLMTCSHHYGD